MLIKIWVGTKWQSLERAPLALCNLVAKKQYGVSNLSVHPDEHLNILTLLLLGVRILPDSLRRVYNLDVSKDIEK